MQKKKILFVYPSDRRSVAIETACRVLREADHEVFLISFMPEGELAFELKQIGVFVSSFVIDRSSTFSYYLGHVRNLTRFCGQHKIDIVWSHMQDASIVAVFSRPFIKAQVFTFRHHDETSFYVNYGAAFNMVRNANEARVDRIINLLSPNIVVLSESLRSTLIKYEGVDQRKVHVLPLIYDFSRYNIPDKDLVERIRKDIPCHLRLIMISRMIPSKQHLIVLKVFKRLICEGYSMALMIMDEGPLLGEIKAFIQENDLSSSVMITGFKKDVINYLDAADLLMHPSLTEVSSNVVKESGLLKKAVAVCEGVGDFNDYIHDNYNGFLLSRDDLERSIEDALRKAYHDKEKLKIMGEALYDSVIKRFSDTQQNKDRYLNLINRNVLRETVAQS